MSDSRATRAEQLARERTAEAQVLALLHIGDAINKLAEAVVSGRRAPIPVRPDWRHTNQNTPRRST